MNTDDPAIPPTPKRRGPRLATAANLRAYVASVIRRVEIGELDSTRARLLVYAASVLGGLITGERFEERIAALEKAQTPDERRLAS